MTPALAPAVPPTHPSLDGAPTATPTAPAWIRACRDDLLTPDRGVAVLLPDGRQVALFRVHGGTLHAVGNVDPFSGAAVLSRGIVGDRAGEPTVASPMHKQVFSLLSGACLNTPGQGVPVWPVRRHGDWIEVWTEFRTEKESA